MTDQENINQDRADAVDILAAIDNFTIEVKAARTELGEERDKRKTVTKIVAVFLALAIIGGVVNFLLYQEIQDERAEDNMERCENYNNLSFGIRRSNATLVSVLVGASSNPERAQQIGDDFLEKLSGDFPTKTCPE